MDRLACVDLPSLPLQLLRRRHPEWAHEPMAVVERDKPLAAILWVNERARSFGVLPGHRYATALARCPSLRAGAVAQAEIDETVAMLTVKLRALTPGVEPSVEEPGVFWLDANGFHLLHKSVGAWARLVRRALADEDLDAVVAVGFSRIGTYASAKARPVDLIVFASSDEETRALKSVSLDRIGHLEPAVRDALLQLGVRTIGQFLALPEVGIGRRFGAAALSLHRLGNGVTVAPLVPAPYVEPLVRAVDLDDAETNLERLAFLVKAELDPLLSLLAARGQAAAEIVFTLTVDKAGPRSERVRPAEPTLDGAQLLELVRLRLATLALAAGVTRLETEIVGAPATAEQLKMFAQQPKRDLKAAARAIARLVAALGAEAVVRARLADGHMPEARFSWEPVDALPPAHPRALDARPALRPVVRRIAKKPQRLPPRLPREPDGWLLDDPREGPVERLDGPYVIEGGWWRNEVRRDYYFAETRAGTLHWIFYDRKSRRWFRQGKLG